MKSRIKALLLSVILSGACVGFTSPVQAHHTDEGIWALYGMVGLLMLDSYATDNQYEDDHRYYDEHKHIYKHSHHRHHTHKMHKKHHRHDRRQCYRKHKHRRDDWDDDD